MNILYIKGEEFSPDKFQSLLDDLMATFEKIINSMEVISPLGIKTKIDIHIELTNPQQNRAVAKRTSKQNGIYEIRLNAGLSHHVWLVSRFVLADKAFFPWIDQCNIIEESVKIKGAREFLADYSYFIGSYCIILHELAHIILGHCDYIADEMGMDAWEEFEKTTISEEHIAIRKAFEAEADRQAGTWLAAFFNMSLGPSLKGIALQFPSQHESYEFYVYSITALLVMLRQLSQEKSILHPLPRQRQTTIIMALLKYNENNNIHSNIISAQRLLEHMVAAGNDLGLVGATNIFEIGNNAINLSFVDDVIERTGIRNFQHTVTQNKSKSAP